MGSVTEANCNVTTSSWWSAFLTNIGVIDGFIIANPMGDANEAILDTIALFVDPATSAAFGFAVTTLMGDATEV
jgi:hypothetical protein